MFQEKKYANQIILSDLEIPIYRRSLIILSGPSGSGKSTFASKYFPSTMTVSTDYCRAMICDSQLNQSVSEDAFEIFYLILEIGRASCRERV